MEIVLAILIPLLIAIFAFVQLFKGIKERKNKGILKSLWSLKFVKGIPDLKEGQAVTLHLYDDKITLNDNQVIPLERVKKAIVFNENELKLKDKSVLGRAAVGALLLGPLGAVVGGMSGVGDKKKEQTLNFLSIEYSDKKGEDGQLIFLGTDGTIGMNGFADLVNKKIGTVPEKITEAYEI